MVCLWLIKHQQILKRGKVLRHKFHGFILNFGAKKRKLKYQTIHYEGKTGRGSKLEEETSVPNLVQSKN